MCGIVGTINPTYQFGKSFMAYGLYADAVRGWDSTGLVRIDSKEVTHYKRALPAADFIESRKFKAMINSQADAFIGHNRAATVGGVTDSTAHPFHHGDIIGVHNGTLDYGWAKTLGVKGFNVDSDALIWHINEYGIEATVKKVEGAFAIVYYDFESDTINMIRNSKRPLYYAQLAGEKETRIAYASEELMLAWLVHKSDGTQAKWVKEVPEGVLISFDLTTMEMTQRKLELAPEVSYYPGPFRNNYGKTTSYSGSSGAWGNRNVPGRNLLATTGCAVGDLVDFIVIEKVPYPHSSRGTVLGTMVEEPWSGVVIYGVELDSMSYDKNYSSKVQGARRDPKDQDNIELTLTCNDITEYVEVEEADVKGPDGKKLSELDYNLLTAAGCSNCGDELVYGVDSKLGWTVENQPICSSCMEIHNQTWNKEAVGNA